MVTQAVTHRLRRAFSVLLIVIASVLAPLLITTGWAVTTVTNTNRFVSTMSALGHNTTITDYIATKGSADVVETLQVQSRLQHRLPAPVVFLAPLIANELSTQLTHVFEHVLQSPKFQHAWDAKLRLVHATFVKVMTSNPATVSTGAKLALNFTPQILEALSKLDAKGITFFDPVRSLLTNNKKVLVTLADQKQFHQLQWYFNAAIKLRWILPLVFLVIAAAAVLLSPRRRRAGTWLGVGVALSCVVMLLLLAFGRQYSMSHAPTPPDVANALFSTLTSFLRWELRIAVLIGAIVAVLLWATGPTPRATSLRRAIGSTGGAAAKKMGNNASTSSALGFIAGHASAFIWVGVGIAAIGLATWVDSLGALVWTVVLTALWVAAILAVRRRFAPTAAAGLPQGT